MGPRIFPFRRRSKIMSSRTANWMMAAGALVMFLGLCFLPSVFGEHSDPELLAPAVGLFSIGALALAGGIYLRARALRGAVEAGDFGKDSGSKRGRGGSICAEARLPQCTVRFTSFISAAIAWPNTTMSGPACTPRPPVRQPARTAGRWQPCAERDRPGSASRCQSD